MVLADMNKYIPFVCPICLSNEVMPPGGWDMMKARTKLHGFRTIMLTLECQECHKEFIECYMKTYVTGVPYDACRTTV